jgi:hypothetical protein
MAEDGGGADAAGPVLVADAGHGLLGDQACLSGGAEADLLGGLVGVDEAGCLRGGAGQAAGSAAPRWPVRF